MKALLFIALSISVALLFCNPRGLTVSEIPCSDVISSHAIPVDHLIEVAPPHSGQEFNRDEWYPSLELDLNLRLPAKQQYGLQFDLISNSAIPFSSMGNLGAQGIQAVAKAPEWLQSELSTILASLEPERQDLWAGLILDTQDPYVDEVAFCIAHSSTTYLNSDYATPQLFTENAQSIYSIDSQLAYVEIRDVGSASAGGNYYSTTRYFKKDSAGQIQQRDLPRELYYWYIVHPKLSDEIAAYIDPSVVENNSNHSNNIAEPPVGKFWRDYLFNLDQEGYPVLADTLSQCQTLFNHDDSTNDAIHAIVWWINQNMSFTSNAERPHQPVRIITKRFGRCGEYADLTSAVARTALIPCTSILSVSTDHTWNEFWDEGWVAWEPVNGYINDPLVYENGWGKIFGSVFEIRSDGLFSPVTERYSEGNATIRIQVVDSNQHPVDGARVVLAILDGSNRFDCEQFTDNSGIATFSVGEGHNYRARVETDFALYPENPGTFSQLTDNAEDDQMYQYLFTLNQPSPIPAFEALSSPPDPVDDHRFMVAFESPGYYISAQNLWDDITILGSPAFSYKYVDSPSDAAFMVLDADNVIFWQLMGEASGFCYQNPASSGSAIFDIPAGQNWYCFVDNSHRHRNSVKLNGSLLYETYGTAIQDEHNSPAEFHVLSSFPNPFRQSVQINLELAKEAVLKVQIFNIKGQLVKHWQTDRLPKGQTELSWDGCSDLGASLASGIYFLKISDGTHTNTRKLIYSK